LTLRVAADDAIGSRPDPAVGLTLVPVPVDDDQAHRGREGNPVPQLEPDIRPLGGLALGLAVLSALFAVTYFLSPLAYLAAALAVLLGLVARGDERIAAMGTASAVIAVVAIIWATVILVLS
jgi:hypothetical protein